MEKESSALVPSLNDQREHVLGILEGLSEDGLRRALLPSGWTCLGMVNHLAVSVERFWLRGVVAGEPIGLMEDADAAWQVDPSVRADALFDLYRQEIELANAIIAATSLDGEPAAWPYEMSPERWFSDLRGVLHHVITETACHAGHLDAVREILDGRLWMA